MKWKVTGYCSLCGECCKALMRTPHMLSHPNFMNLDNWCKYLFNKDSKWYCEIRIAHNDNDIEFLEMIPKVDREYYDEECKDYPDINKEAHIPPMHKLLDVCTYKITEGE